MNFFIQREGQSLTEVLIAVALGAVLILGAITIIAPAIRSNTAATRTQAGAAAAKELLDNVRVLSQASWSNISSLSTSSATTYFLITSSSPFVATSGQDLILIGTSTFVRYFQLSEVGRDAGDAIVTSGGTNDPSSRQVRVVYGPSGGPTSTLDGYITRFGHKTFWQTDWSGGDGQSGPVTTTNSSFASSTNINFTTSTGSFMLNI